MTLDCVRMEFSLAAAVRRFWWLEVSVSERQPSKLPRQLQSKVQCNSTGPFMTSRTRIYPTINPSPTLQLHQDPLRHIRYYKADTRTLSTSTLTKPPRHIDTHRSEER